MAERPSGFVESLRDYLQFVARATSLRPMTIEPLDLGLFAAVSVLLYRMALVLPPSGHADFSVPHLILAVISQATLMVSELGGWVMFALYLHGWAWLLGGRAGFSATLCSTAAALTCSYAIGSLIVASYALAASVIGVSRGAIAGHAMLIALACHVVMLVWLVPVRVGGAHALEGPQRTPLALAPLVPVAVVGFLFYSAVSFLGKIHGI